MNKQQNKVFDIYTLSYKDFPSLIESVLLTKVASARANAHFGLISSESAKLIEEVCLQMTKDASYDTVQGNIYGGSKYALIQAVDGAILQKSEQINDKDLSQSLSVNATLYTSFELLMNKELEKVVCSCDHFQEVIVKLANNFKGILKVGRLGLKDNMPIDLSSQFFAYCTALRRLREKIATEQSGWTVSCLGASEIGTMLPLPEGWAEFATDELNKLTKRKLNKSEDYIDCIQGTDRLILSHAHIQALSNLIWKIARDLRLMCSGPRGGIQEITLPAVAPGSSIMPGKLNPVIAEMVFNTVDQVDANHAGLTLALKSGWLEGGTNSFVPLRSVINSCDLLSRTMDCFANRCLIGIEVNQTQLDIFNKKSLAIRFVLSDIFGAEFTNKLVDDAKEKQISLETVFRLTQKLPSDFCDDLFDLNTLANPAKLNQLIVKTKSYLENNK